MHMSALTADYTIVSNSYSKVFSGLSREAPAFFKHKGVFLIATSGCTGWEPNKLEVFWSRSVMQLRKLSRESCMSVNLWKSHADQ